jgi:hypothetical protein
VAPGPQEAAAADFDKLVCQRKDNTSIDLNPRDGLKLGQSSRDVG